MATITLKNRAFPKKKTKRELERATWVLEPQVFGLAYEQMLNAVRDAGHDLVLWEDTWRETGDWPRLADRVVVFHGSLGNAARVRSELSWRPGAFCATKAFRCTAWYPMSARWLLHYATTCVTMIFGQRISFSKKERMV